MVYFPFLIGLNNFKNLLRVKFAVDGPLVLDLVIEKKKGSSVNVCDQIYLRDRRGSRKGGLLKVDPGSSQLVVTLTFDLYHGLTGVPFLSTTSTFFFFNFSVLLWQGKGVRWDWDGSFHFLLIHL